MKSQKAISRRAQKLRSRYAKKHIKASQHRCPENCQYGHEHAPSLQGRDPDVVELSLAPRETTTTLVFQEDGQIVHLCMCGADDPMNWPGDVCDDDVAKRCKWFKPKKSAKEAHDEFMELLVDDEWVYENHRDVAALQWVLDNKGHRVSRRFLSVWERIWLWFVVCFTFVKKPAPSLPPFEDIGDVDLMEGKCDEELVGVWDDDSSEDSGT